MTEQTTFQDSRVILANHEMALGKIATILNATAEAMENIEPALGQLYDKADQQGDEAGKSAVMVTWERAKQLENHIQQLNANFAGMGATVKSVLDQRDQIAGELESLMNAIDESDWEDQRLSDLVSDITEWVEEGMMMYADEAAWEGVYDQISDNLRGYGLTGPQADNALALLQGETTLNEEQVEMLRMLLDSIVQHGEAH